MTYQKVIPLFDKDTQKFGIAVGQALKKTIRQAKAKNIRSSDKDKLKALAYDNYVEEFRAAGLMNSEESDLSGSMPTKEDEIFEGGSTFSNQSTSTTQKQVLAKINQAMSNSKSYLEATDKLADINNGIPLTVPAQEQVGLQRAIAALYYTLDAMTDDLVAEWVLEGESKKAQLEIRPRRAGFSFLGVWEKSKNKDEWVEYLELSGSPNIKKKSWWNSFIKVMNILALISSVIMVITTEGLVFFGWCVSLAFSAEEVIKDWVIPRKVIKYP